MLYYRIIQEKFENLIKNQIFEDNLTTQINRVADFSVQKTTIGLLNLKKSKEDYRVFLNRYSYV